MTEILRFIVTLPADVIPKLAGMVRIQDVIGDVKQMEVQIAAALAVAAQHKFALSAHLPGLAVVLYEDNLLPEVLDLLRAIRGDLTDVRVEPLIARLEAVVG